MNDKKTQHPRSTTGLAPESLPWLKPHWQVLLFTALCGVYAATRLAGTTALKIDDALEVYRSQSLEWVYAPANPPLYTWLLSGVHQVLGTGPQASMLLNYSLLIAIFAFILLSARRVLGDNLAAALAAWSLLLIRQFTRANFTMTHSILLMALCAMSFWLVLRLLDNQRPTLAFGLGVVLGLGLLSKFNFAAFLVCLGVAACLQPRTRSLLAPRLAIWILAGLAAITGPYFVAYASAGFDIVDVVTVRIDPGEAVGYGARLVSGLTSAGTSVGVFLCVVTAAVLLSSPQGALRAARPVMVGVWPQSPEGGAVAFRLTRDLFLVALALILLGVLSGTVTRVSERYLHPFLLVPVPILAAAWLAAAHGGRRALQRFAGIVAAFALGVFLLLVLEMSPFCPQACRDQTPYPGLADSLRAAGFTGDGTVVAGSPIIAGNLRHHFPHARVWLAGSPYEPPLHPETARFGPSNASQCLIIWQHDDCGGTIAAPAEALHYAGISREAADGLAQTMVVPSERPFVDWSDLGRGFAPREHVWSVILFDAGSQQGRCF